MVLFGHCEDFGFYHQNFKNEGNLFIYYIYLPQVINVHLILGYELTLLIFHLKIHRSLPKMDLRIEIFILKLVYTEMFMIRFGDSARELRRFENFCFYYTVNAFVYMWEFLLTVAKCSEKTMHYECPNVMKFSI